MLLLLPLLACAPSPTSVIDSDAPADSGADSGADTEADTEAASGVDGDGDGYDDVASGGDDCDDADAAVHPDAAEVCDGIDNDCDGLTDAADPTPPELTTSYRDSDGDGYGVEAESTTGCGVARGFAALAGDCADEDDAINPSAEEICDDGGADEDCDGAVDEGFEENTVFYRDADGDGWGDATSVIASEGCATPTGYAAAPGDCDDGDDARHPTAGDVAGDGEDPDCDGMDCEAGGIGDAYFAVCLEDIAWHDARALCQSSGNDDLASVEGEDEQAMIEGLLISADAWGSDAPWIGYADELVEGSWGWSNGSKSTWSAWGPDEPNGGLVENCAQLNFPLETGDWNDADCGLADASTAFVCERR